MDIYFKHNGDRREVVSEGSMSNARSPARKRVLLVDDSSFCRKLMTMVLEKQGIEVITLDSPLRFSLVVRETRPDLALVDVAMPEFSGDRMVACARRQMDALCPIVFFSDSPEEELAVLVSKYDGLGYIRKSSNWDSIVASVTTFLSLLTPQSREGID
jgi:DNA-binding response OmpR family regulator